MADGNPRARWQERPRGVVEPLPSLQDLAGLLCAALGHTDQRDILAGTLRGIPDSGRLLYVSDATDASGRPLLLDVLAVLDDRDARRPPDFAPTEPWAPLGPE